MRTATSPPQPSHDRTAAVVVEFAICAPILFLFFFASLEFSRVNMIRQSVENAVYEGARRGIVPGATAANCRAWPRPSSTRSPPAAPPSPSLPR